MMDCWIKSPMPPGVVDVMLRGTCWEGTDYVALFFGLGIFVLFAFFGLRWFLNGRKL
jgi:hypothetical protein